MLIRFDGKDYDLSKLPERDAYTAAIEAWKNKVAADLTAATARADAADAALAKLRADGAGDLARFDAAVSARVSLEGTAARVLGAEFKPTTKDKDGKDVRLTDRAIRELVIRKDNAAWSGEGKDDGYVAAYFDATVARLDADGRIENLPAVIQAVKLGARADAESFPDPEKDRREMIAANRGLTPPAKTN